MTPKRQHHSTTYLQVDMIARLIIFFHLTILFNEKIWTVQLSNQRMRRREGPIWSRFESFWWRTKQPKQKTKNYDRDVNREIDYNHRDLHGRREDVVGLPFLEGLLWNDGLLQHFAVVLIDKAIDVKVDQECCRLCRKSHYEGYLDVPVCPLRIWVTFIVRENLLK